MDLRKDLVLTIGTVVALTILLAFGSIAVMLRMGPAIDRILRDNIESISAAESLLGELALEAPLSEEGAGRARLAIARAAANVTEPGERAVISALSAELDAELAGDPHARARLVERLQTLIGINRDVMRRVDLDAQRLSAAGAWAAVFVAVAAFGLSFFVLARLGNRVLLPIEELEAALSECRAGNALRRVTPMPAPSELTRVAQDLNALLDERLERRRRDGPGPLERAALLALLDREPKGAVLLDHHGAWIRASRSLLEALAREDGVALRAAVARDGAGERIALEGGALVFPDPAASPSR